MKYRAQVLAELKKKFSGLTDYFLGFWADKISAKITEETQIAAELTKLDDLPVSLPDLEKEYQKNADYRVKEALKKQKGSDAPDNDDDKKSDDKKDDKPDWSKQFADLQKQFTQLQAQQTQRSFSERLAKVATDKKIPAQFLKGKIVEKEEDFDTLVAEIEKDYNDVKQSFIDEGFGNSKTPALGVTESKSANIDADILAWANQGKTPEKK